MGKKRTKDIERAKKLRKEGWSLSEIAEEVNASSKGQVSVWVRDVVLSEEAQNILDSKNPATKNYIKNRICPKRYQAISEAWREKRRKYQQQGYQEANGDLLHIVGCMLYWGEGTKNRNTVELSNSDPDIIKCFLRFLRKYYNTVDEDCVVYLQISDYTKKSQEEILEYWANNLNLPIDCFRQVRQYKQAVKNPHDKLGYYGVCSIRIYNTAISQRIFGAIKKYGNIKNADKWLD